MVQRGSDYCTCNEGNALGVRFTFTSVTRPEFVQTEKVYDLKECARGSSTQNRLEKIGDQEIYAGAWGWPYHGSKPQGCR